MIPYPYNMVDMGGIDLAEANGTVVDGLYSKIVEALDACGDVVLYNWKFAGIEIAPQHTQILLGSGELRINTLIQVTEQDAVTVLGLPPVPPPIVPVSPLVVSENGIYNATPPASGFNPVTVNVPAPILLPLNASENGIYNPEDYEADGFNSVTVQVDSTGILEGSVPPSSEVGSDGDYYLYNAPVDQFVIGITISQAARGTNYQFNYWGARDIQLLFETPNGDALLKDIAGARCYWAAGSGAFTEQSAVISGGSSSYYEYSNLPGYWKIVLPSSVLGYAVKGLRILPRDDSSYRDFYRSFSLGIWLSDKEEAMNLLTVTDSVQSDWNFSGYTDFSFTPVELTGTVPYFYKKINGDWILVK